MSVPIPAIFIAVLFLHNAYILWRFTDPKPTLTRFLVKVLPRLAFGILYMYFFFSEIGWVREINITERGNWVRAALVYLAVTETIGHWVLIEKLRRIK